SFHSPVPTPALPSFPTRRSSDLLPDPMYFRIRTLVVFIVTVLALPTIGMASVIFQPGKKAKYVVPGEEEISGNAAELFQIGQTRSEEHTSELQSLAYLVCLLLLE